MIALILWKMILFNEPGFSLFNKNLFLFPNDTCIRKNKV